MCRKNRKKEIEGVDKPASEYTSNLTFQEIELLNSDLYRICGEMHENKDFINNPVLKSVMWKEITKAYIAKSNEIKESKTIPEEIRRWTLEEKNKLAIPDYELLRRFPLRRYGLNEVAKQCMKQAQIEAAMEFAAREAEIERQREFIDGAEPDAVTEFFYLLAEEFIPARKRKRFINSRYERVSRLLTEYAQAEAVDGMYSMLLTELTRKRKREKFEEQNGEYLKILVKDFIQKYIEEIAALTPEEAPASEAATPAPSEEGQPEQAAESEEPEEPAEDAEDDLSALYELADEPDVEEPAAPGEVQEHAEQAATASEEAPEQANDVADDVEQMQMLMPQSEGSAEPEEPDTGANADKGEETENTD